MVVVVAVRRSSQEPELESARAGRTDCLQLPSNRRNLAKSVRFAKSSSAFGRFQSLQYYDEESRTVGEEGAGGAASDK